MEKYTLVPHGVTRELQEHLLTPKTTKNRSNLTVWEPGASLQHLQTCTLLQEHNMALNLLTVNPMHGIHAGFDFSDDGSMV